MVIKIECDKCGKQEVFTEQVQQRWLPWTGEDGTQKQICNIACYYSFIKDLYSKHIEEAKKKIE